MNKCLIRQPLSVLYFSVLLDFKIVFSRPKVTLDLFIKDRGTAAVEGTRSVELTVRSDVVLDTALVPLETA